MISDGVKMTLSFCCPAVGAVVAAVHANVPLTEAVPPVSVDNASVWPYVIVLAAGHAVMVGVVCVFWVVPLPPPPQPATNRTALTSKNGERSLIIVLSSDCIDGKIAFHAHRQPERIAYPRSNHGSCLGCRVNAKVTRGART
jgi:hypothetical protein